MNRLGEDPIMPETFLYGCVLEPEKDVIFNPKNDEFEHQLDLRMACVDSTTKDELHTVEVEGQDIEGQKVKALLVSLKPSTLPSASLGFMITPPAVFRLKSGSGPIHLSGQHHVIMGGDQSFDEDEDDDEEVEEELQASKKRPAASPGLKSQKKIKLDMEEEEEDDDEDDEDDEEEEDDEEDDEDDEEEEVTPVKAKAVLSTPKVPAQNGKNSKQSATPKQTKTPNKDEKTKSPQTPKAPLTINQLKSKMMETMKKGVILPKTQPKFENFLKNGYRVSETQVIAELWKWRQTVKDAK